MAIGVGTVFLFPCNFIKGASRMTWFPKKGVGKIVMFDGVSVNKQGRVSQLTKRVATKD